MNLYTYLAAFLFSCLSYISAAQNTSTLNIYNDDIHLSYRTDTAIVTDPATGTIKEKYKRTPVFTYEDGRSIYHGGEAKEPLMRTKQQGLESYLKQLFADELSKAGKTLDYVIVVIDEKGKPSCFMANLLSDEDEADGLIKSMMDKFSPLAFAPARKDGKPVPYLVSITK